MFKKEPILKTDIRMKLGPNSSIGCAKGKIIDDKNGYGYKGLVVVLSYLLILYFILNNKKSITQLPSKTYIICFRLICGADLLLQ